jgi:hypothetical protein
MRQVYARVSFRKNSGNVYCHRIQFVTDPYHKNYGRASESSRINLKAQRRALEALALRAAACNVVTNTSFTS